MSISSDLLEILVCPENHHPLRLADKSELEALNKKIQEGTINNRAGQPVKQLIDGALFRDDNKVAYPIRENIPVLLIDEALLVNDL